MATPSRRGSPRSATLQVPLPEGRKKYTKTMPMQPDDLAACLAWCTSKKRTENDHAWKVDFKSLLADATARATPHWHAAQTAATRAQKLERQAKDLAAGLRTTPAGKEADQQKARLRELNDSAAAARAAESREKSAGDAIYWPLFNLDRKNPRAPNDLEHRPPLELVHSILSKERDILRLMEEIQSEIKALA